jgi:hypothetical protein
LRVQCARVRGAVHRLPEIAAALHVQPEIRAVAEHAGEDKRGGGSYVPAVVAQLIDVLALDAHRLGQRDLGESHRPHKFFDECLADSGRFTLRGQHGWAHL